MSKEDRKWIVLILLILFVGIFPRAESILVWFIKNIVTPIGKIEDVAWALDSSNPWVWVFRLTVLIVLSLITVTAYRTLKTWVKERI